MKKTTRKLRDPARFFTALHGHAAYSRLAAMLQAGVSGGEIGRTFGVSRQRVHQWRQKFGFVKATKKK